MALTQEDRIAFAKEIEQNPVWVEMKKALPQQYYLYWRKEPGERERVGHCADIFDDVMKHIEGFAALGFDTDVDEEGSGNA
ncbi:MAG: hypothetical protein PVI97_00645 [Candidatus Thiodiazotropha sp.]|jgi:hypothetical protein